MKKSFSCDEVTATGLGGGKVDKNKEEFGKLAIPCGVKLFRGHFFYGSSNPQHQQKK
jgi:hypothetical protein